jgi:methyltransferase
MVTWWLFLMILLVISQRCVELYIARRNRTWALQAGAQEFGERHYLLFFLLHVGWLIGVVGEAIRGGILISELWYGWLSVFILAQGLRYWCIISLGRCWNTRILVIPGSQSISCGPYRLLRHPNYIAVALELISVPLIFGAVITAVITTLLNIWLLLAIRIPEEEKALKLLK